MPTPDETGMAQPSAMATTSQAVAAAGAADGQAPGFRDREPPPQYDGEDPESTFTLWERNVRLWEFETDVPRLKRGVKLMRALTGTARIAVEEMPFEEIASEDGLRNIMGRLREFFQPHLEVSLPRAFENAVYGQPRTSKEGFRGIHSQDGQRVQPSLQRGCVHARVSAGIHSVSSGCSQ